MCLLGGGICGHRILHAPSRFDRFVQRKHIDDHRHQHQNHPAHHDKMMLAKSSPWGRVPFLVLVVMTVVLVVLVHAVILFSSVRGIEQGPGAQVSFATFCPPFGDLARLRAPEWHAELELQRIRKECAVLGRETA